MSIGLNDWSIMGNLGGDPEMQFTPRGNPTTRFNVAVSRRVASGQDKEQKEQTEWVQVITWNKLAESCNQHLRKGVRVFAQGRMHLNHWQDTAGQNHSKVQLIAESVIFLDRKIQTQEVTQVEDEQE